jgi:hypothetical protein
MVPRANRGLRTVWAKVITGIMLAAIGVAVWRFMSAPADVPQPTIEPAATPSPVGSPGTGTSSSPPTQVGRDVSAEPKVLNEHTLVGTKWEREGFGLEFSADGKLLIGGRERARWRVEGSRIRLYRETTGEEHWLDIVGDKLMWQDKEIARVP